MLRGYLVDKTKCRELKFCMEGNFSFLNIKEEVSSLKLGCCGLSQSLTFCSHEYSSAPTKLDAQQTTEEQKHNHRPGTFQVLFKRTQQLVGLLSVCNISFQLMRSVLILTHPKITPLIGKGLVKGKSFNGTLLPDRSEDHISVIEARLNLPALTIYSPQPKTLPTHRREKKKKKKLIRFIWFGRGLQIETNLRLSDGVMISGGR